MLHELGYADDAAFVADTWEKLAQYAQELAGHYESWGLRMSVAKTEAMTSRDGPLPASLPVDASLQTRGNIHFTSHFKYLGSTISGQGCEAEVRKRLDIARRAFWRLSSSVWNVSQLSLSTKMHVYRACVISTLLYGCASWTTAFQCRHQ